MVVRNNLEEGPPVEELYTDEIRVKLPDGRQLRTTSIDESGVTFASDTTSATILLPGPASKIDRRVITG